MVKTEQKVPRICSQTDTQTDMLATILRPSSGDGVEIIANKVHKKLFLQYIHIFSCEINSKYSHSIYRNGAKMHKATILAAKISGRTGTDTIRVLNHDMYLANNYILYYNN